MRVRNTCVKMVNNRYKKESESYEDYVYGKLRLIELLSTALTANGGNAVSEKRKIDYLICGLPKHVAREIYRQSPAKATDVLPLLRVHDKFDTIYGHGPKIPKAGVKEIDSEDPGMYNPFEVMEGIRASVEEIKGEVNALQNWRQSKSQGYNQKGKPNKYNSGNFTKQEDDKDEKVQRTDNRVECWNCGLKGHIKINCRRPRREPGTPRQNPPQNESQQAPQGN